MGTEGSVAGFTLAGDGAIIRFEADGYGIPQPPDIDWVRGTFRAEIGPWSGSFEGVAFHDELERLNAEIERAAEQPKFEVSFDPTEPHLVFEARSRASGGEGTGAAASEYVEVEGRLDHNPILGTALWFVFGSDRRRLAETARGIREVLERLPSRGTGRR